jgi:hypothetical protein
MLDTVPMSSKWVAAMGHKSQHSNFSGRTVGNSDAKNPATAVKPPHFSGEIDRQCRIARTYRAQSRRGSR